MIMAMAGSHCFCRCLVLLFFVLFAFTLSSPSTKTKNHHNKKLKADAETDKPNIVLLVADDWGFNDVVWHGHTDTEMPFLQQHIADEALIIDTHYVYPLCSITRSALMTGRYPIRYGLQSSIIENGYPYGLSIFEKLMSEELKEHGYQTAIVGKWHLGFNRPDMTPLYRGFDEFYGSLSPALDYYDHNYSVTVGPKVYNGFDLQINGKMVSHNQPKTYITHFERDSFIEVMNMFEKNNAAPEQRSPFFIYVALHASHYPFSAPEQCSYAYKSKLDKESRCKAGVSMADAMNSCAPRIGAQAATTCADMAIEDMFTHLKSNDLWENTLIIALSDNGAPVDSGDNYPLRSGKEFLYEGGTRTPAFVTGGYLNPRRRQQIFDTSTVIHVTDWFPTILAAIGFSNEEIYGGRRQFDGKNLWHAIQYGVIDEELNSKNREFLYNIDSHKCMPDAVCGAYRYGEYKLIWQSNIPISRAFWTNKFSANTNKDGFLDHLKCGDTPIEQKSKAFQQEFEAISTATATAEESAAAVSNTADFNPFLSQSQAVDSQITALVNSELEDITCYLQPCLFNIVDDPCEYHNLAADKTHSHLYNYMLAMLLAYDDIATEPLVTKYTNFDVRSQPSLFHGSWTPWMNNYGSNFVDDKVGNHGKNMVGNYVKPKSKTHSADVEFEQRLMPSQEMVESGVQYFDTDLASSRFYASAMKYKHKYVTQERDAKLRAYHSTLEWLSIIVIAIVVVGCGFVAVKWFRYCRFGINPESNSQSQKLSEQEMRVEFMQKMDAETEPLLSKAKPMTYVEANTIPIPIASVRHT